MRREIGPPETTAWEYPFADNSWKVEFEEFANAIDEGRQPLGNLADAAAALQIIDQVYGRGQA